MKIYLDDNFTQRVFVALLRKAGHSIVRPSDANLAGASDARHLEHAIRAGLVVLSKDASDFNDLHKLVLTSGGSHPGVVLVRYDNDSTRDLTPKQVVSALGKLERSGLNLSGLAIILNHWR